MFNLANLCTAGNLMSGILAILLVFTGNLVQAPYAIFLGLIFDFLDGFVARLFKTSGELGKQLDSLADMVTFGVAPGIIMMAFMAANPAISGGSEIYVATDFSQWVRAVVHLERDVSYLPLTALLIPFFALFRLAKFNIDTRQSHSFLGLPTPANTLFFMAFPLSIRNIGADFYDSPIYQFIYNPWFISVLILIMGILMISEVPLFALKFKQYKFKGNEIRYSFLLISLVLIPVFGVWSIALIVFLYLILSLVENTFFKKKENEI
ncbi:MAG: CDP-alcohol phosphatidyltransferase family protein [Crocinitomicaceae bacterium]|nr:CDP-alcohol phosphatidyltransferase family protein [Crocinitomicaceae bacterium]